MGFPFEIITMLGSTLLSSLLSIWSQSRKAKEEQQKLLITRGEFEMKAKQQSLDHGLKDKGFAWTRRIIALVSVFAIVVLPKMVAVFYPDVDVTVGYTNWNPGFWFFREGRDVFEWITFQGLVITQLDTNLVSAIIGMYFGGSLVKK
jgi:hypothetical protein|tara:strand:+ start:13232 stop:13672 length:441 start_codon:yes stop_codon:yes gene_type:complete